MQCPQCRHENSASAKFCSECGHKLASVCPQCSHANSPEAKFCSECGHPLNAPQSTPAQSTPPSISPPQSTQSTLSPQTQPQLAGERRKMTILFADLSGSTALGEKFDAEEVYNVMNECFAGLTAIIDRHEGFVLKFIGDCIMALFGAPVAHGDDPQRAVQSALEMQEWLQKFSEDLQREKGVPFRMRIGLNFGGVIAGGVGSDVKKEYDVLGDAVNVAQRLEAAAEPGTVYVSDAVWRLTRRQFEYCEVGEVTVKGRAEPVQVFRAVSPRAVDDEAEIAFEGRLIGRDAEWQKLTSAVAALLDGRGQIVTMTGEPGIGKTRLLEDLAHYAAEAGAMILAARCEERHASRPFAVFIAALRQLCGAHDADNPVEISRKVDAWISKCGAELNEWQPYLTQILAPQHASEYSVLDEETRKQLTVQALGKVFDCLGRKNLLLFSIDDLHLIDEVSLEVVRELANRENSPLLLVLASRPGATFEWAPQHLAFTLDVLPREQCLEMIGQFVSPQALPAPLIEAILDRSGGNPQYLKEVVRSLLDVGHLFRDQNGDWQAGELEKIEVPDTVYGAVLARLDRLETSARAILQRGAVAGFQFPVRLIEALLERPDDLPSTLRELESLEFLREVHPPPQWEQRFKHSSVREVAYEALLLQERKILHRRVAEILELLYPNRAADLAPTLAHHYEQAEIWPRALEFYVRAGRQSALFFANEEAAAHYHSAINLLPKISEADRVASPHELDALEGLTAVRAGQGDYEKAIAHCRAALDCACLKQLPEDLAALRAASLRWRLADCWLRTGRINEAEKLLREAFGALRLHQGRNYDRERSRLISHLGFSRYRAGCYRHAQRWGRLAFRLAERAEDDIEKGTAANIMGLAAQALGQTEEARRCYEIKSEVATRSGDISGIGIVQNNLGTLFYQQGRLDEAEKAYELALAQWRKTGSVDQLATTYNNIGNVHLARGDFEAAAQSFYEAIEMFHRVGQPHGQATAMAVLGEVELERGQIETSIALLEEAREISQTLSALDLTVYILTNLAAASVEQGALETATEYSEEVLDLNKALNHAPFAGIAHRILGKIARLRGEYSVAETELEYSLALFADHQLQHELGRTLIEIGMLKQAQGQNNEAEYSLREAIRVLRAIGAQADEERAAMLLTKLSKPQ